MISSAWGALVLVNDELLLDGSGSGVELLTVAVFIVSLDR